MSRYFLEIAYDGTNYHGWQIQDNSETVQGVLTTCLQHLLKDQGLKVTGCGRTDTGVRASHFYAHFDSDGDTTNLVYKLNSYLPNDIAVYQLYEVGSECNTRFDATERTYKYFIHQLKDPFLDQYSWYMPHELDVEKMNQAAKLVLGEKDFTSFSKLHTQTKTNNCSVSLAEWSRESHRLIFTISADRFLRNMVRAVVGTLIEVGKGKIEPQEVAEIIERKDRGEAGVSVPAKGLFLQNIKYPYELKHV